jgi:ATP-dependent helicase HrpA
MNFRVVDEHGRQLGMGRKLAELKRALGAETEAILRDEAPLDDAERHTAWTFGDLAEMMELQRGGHTLVGYPALVDAGDGVTLQVFDSPEKARELHRAGVRRLLAIAFKERVRDLEKTLGRDLALAPLKEDIIAAAMDRTFLADSLPHLRADFARRVDEGRSRFSLIAQEIARTAGSILAEHAQVQKRIAALARGHPQQVADVKEQCARLLERGFVARLPWERLQHLPRYLKAAAARLDKLRADPARDQRLAAQIAPLHSAWLRAKPGRQSPELEQFRWLLEELRVSLFAQELRTPVPVSAKRLAKLWQTIQR